MESKQKKGGFSLVEMLIVLAVIVLLASLVIGLAGRIENQGKERLTKSTIALLVSALEQFRDFGYQYPDNPGYTPEEREFYLGLDFSIDCSGFEKFAVEGELSDVMNASSVTIIGFDSEGIEYPVVDHDISYSGCEVLCYFLNQILQCKQWYNGFQQSNYQL